MHCGSLYTVIQRYLPQLWAKINHDTHHRVKWHLVIHMAMYIRLYGSPKGWGTQDMEAQQTAYKELVSIAAFKLPARPLLDSCVSH